LSTAKTLTLQNGPHYLIKARLTQRY